MRPATTVCPGSVTSGVPFVPKQRTVTSTRTVPALTNPAFVRNASFSRNALQNGAVLAHQFVCAERRDELSDRAEGAAVIERARPGGQRNVAAQSERSRAFDLEQLLQKIGEEPRLAVCDGELREPRRLRGSPSREGCADDRVVAVLVREGQGRAPQRSAGSGRRGDDVDPLLPAWIIGNDAHRIGGDVVELRGERRSERSAICQQRCGSSGAPGAFSSCSWLKSAWG